MTATILFAIDDEKMMRDVFNLYFEQNHLEPYQIFRDPQVFKDSFTKNVGVAVLDNTLQHEITGIDLARWIRQQNGRDTEIIFMTGTEDPQTLVDIANVGVYKIVRKDGDMTTLINHIKSARDIAQKTLNLRNLEHAIRKHL